jgi:endonuclease YncB( thermonuclease family)
MAKSKPRSGQGRGRPGPVCVPPGERVWRRRTLLLALLALGLAWAAEARAQHRPEISDAISGHAVALDGNTLLVEGRRVRLWGIDAPGMRSWPWGAYARTALSALIGPGPVACRVVVEDRHHRPVAICSSDTLQDIGAAALVVGYAVTSRRSTFGAHEPEPNIGLTYDLREEFARGLRRGLWRDWPGLGK